MKAQRENVLAGSGARSRLSMVCMVKAISLKHGGLEGSLQCKNEA